MPLRMWHSITPIHYKNSREHDIRTPWCLATDRVASEYTFIRVIVKWMFMKKHSNYGFVSMVRDEGWIENTALDHHIARYNEACSVRSWTCCWLLPNKFTESYEYAPNKGKCHHLQWKYHFGLRNFRHQQYGKTFLGEENWINSGSQWK